MIDSMQNEQIALSSRLRHRAVGDDGVLVHLDNGRVIVVNEVGLHIVQQLATPKTRQELTDSITAAFDVDTAQAEADLDIYLAELKKEQVLGVDQTGSTKTGSDPASNGSDPIEAESHVPD